MKITILTSIFAASIVMAETPTTSLQEATKLAEVIELKKQLLVGFEAMLPAIKSQSEALNLTPELEAELTQIYRDWFTEDIDQAKLEKQIIQLYANTFTSEELKQLIAFYDTDLGKKTLLALPKITQESAQYGIIEGQAKQQQLIDRLQPFIEKNQSVEQDRMRR